MATQKLVGDLQVTGSIRGSSYVGIDRANLVADDLAAFQILPTDWRTWDALATNLPGTPGNDDLGLEEGTFGTDFPYVWAGDLKSAGATTRRAAVLLKLGPEYVAAGDLRIRLHAGMLTNPADTTCVVDVEVYESDGEGVAAGSPDDLCTTAQQSINSTTLADYDFTLDSSGLTAGAVLIARVSITCTDAAGGSIVDAAITEAKLLADIRG